MPNRRELLKWMGLGAASGAYRLFVGGGQPGTTDGQQANLTITGQTQLPR